MPKFGSRDRSRGKSVIGLQRVTAKGKRPANPALVVLAHQADQLHSSIPRHEDERIALYHL
jgi:hypothetical protein